MGFEFEWVVARRGSVRHARLTRIDKRTASRLDASVSEFAGGPYNLPLAAGVLVCAPLPSHPLPLEVRSVDSTSPLKVCTVCSEVLPHLERLG